MATSNRLRQHKACCSDQNLNLNRACSSRSCWCWYNLDSPISTIVKICMARSKLLRPSTLCSMVKNCMAVIIFLRPHNACCEYKSLSPNCACSFRSVWSWYNLDSQISAMVKISMARRKLLRPSDLCSRVKSCMAAISLLRPHNASREDRSLNPNRACSPRSL